jgi:sugar-phosphatase
VRVNDKNLFTTEHRVSQREEDESGTCLTFFVLPFFLIWMVYWWIRRARWIGSGAHGPREKAWMIRRVAPHLDAEAEAAAIENHEAHDQSGVVVMPGAVDLVKSIPDGRWGVVTSGTRLLASNRLRHCGLPVPEVLVTSDDVVNGKPDPEPYLKGAERLGLRPAECLVVEDAPAGIASARAGGMKVIGMASTYDPAKLADADAVVRRFAQISVRGNGNGLRVVVED